jgi:DNA adenine methylase Dam
MEIKGPFSYSGNKYKIYKKFLTHVVDGFDNVVELFGGSAPLLYNSKNGGLLCDTNPAVCFLHTSLGDRDLSKRVEDLYQEFFPGKIRTKEGYLKLREEFNKKWVETSFSPEIAPHFHLLVQLSFNSLIRFGPSGFNVPFGRKEPDPKRIQKHSEIFREKNIKIFYGSYTDAQLGEYNPETTLIYLDPPYRASKYHYSGWTYDNEVSLLKYIDGLMERGYKFVLSNTLFHRDVKNTLLENWISKRDVKVISTKQKYNMWSSAVVSVQSFENTREVLVTNIKKNIN